MYNDCVVCNVPIGTGKLGGLFIDANVFFVLFDMKAKEVVLANNKM